MIADNLQHVQRLIHLAEKRAHRPLGSVQLLAVSKKQSLENIRTAINVGQHCFGENYLQEARTKQIALHGVGQTIEWHFIGAIQANKTREIAEHFQWVHTVCRAKIADRLNEQRPSHLPPLNICLEVNLNDEPSKAGVTLADLPALAFHVATLPRLRLRGLMAIPAPLKDDSLQQEAFARLREAQEALCQAGLVLDTLSMGMSDDFEVAIREGATIVRIGTAIFGSRT